MSAPAPRRCSWCNRTDHRSSMCDSPVVGLENETHPGEKGLKAVDFVACGRCKLRGHVEKDCDLPRSAAGLWWRREHPLGI